MNTAMHVRVVGGIQNGNVHIFVTEKTPTKACLPLTLIYYVFLFSHMPY